MADGAYAGVRVLVTGAAGFIGRSVAGRLTEQGADLHLVVRDAAQARAVFERWGVHGAVVSADLADPADVAARVHAARPDVVFNLAGYGVNPAERARTTARDINSHLPAVLALAMADVPVGAWPGRRLVHVGSALEYGAASGDLVESTPEQPTTVYGTTKLMGTRAVIQACRQHGLPGIVTRLFTVYGPGEVEGRLLPTLLRARQHNEPIPLTNGLQRRDFTFVADVADGLLRVGALAGELPPLVNIATGTLTTVRAFTEEAARVLGVGAHRLQFGALPTRPEEMRHEPVTIERLRALTGWQPRTDIPTGIARSAAFLRDARRD